MTRTLPHLAPRRDGSRPAAVPAGVTRATVTLAALATVAVLMWGALFTWGPGLAQARAGVVEVDVAVERVAGEDRYATAVAAAEKAYPDWSGVSHVVVASGEDDGSVDALTAGGLCWAYDAPLLLTSREALAPRTARALREMVSANTTVQVHIVGGWGPVPEQRFIDIRAIVGDGNVDRVSGDDRFGTSAAVARRMAAVARETSGTVMPDVALFANAADDASFTDALVMSALSARTGAPLLLSTGSSVPSGVGAVLTDLGLERRIVAGGPGVVSDGLVAALDAERWSGGDRYATAVEVARRATAEGWLDPARVGLAASVPDALSGSASLGRLRHPLLLTSPDRLPAATAYELGRAAVAADGCTVFGGEGAVTPAVAAQLGGAPAEPLISVSNGSETYVAARIRVRATTGANTSRIRAYVDGEPVLEKEVGSFEIVDLGELPTEAATTRVRVETVSREGEVAASERSFTSLGYAWSDYIVIDKGDFRLYLVKDGLLVKSYPIAVGKAGWETPPAVWRILSKSHMPPSGIFGPRWMRLYRRVGSPGSYGYGYTSYGVHGTNQPWVIGTKASHGCIRLYNEDILDLYPRVPIGMTVVTRE